MGACIDFSRSLTPTNNATVEPFNLEQVRSVCLRTNKCLFRIPCAKNEASREDSNLSRLHSTPGWITPSGVA